MKEHLEGLKCLRQSMAAEKWLQKWQVLEGATTSILLRTVAATTEEEANKDSTLTPTKEVEERHKFCPSVIVNQLMGLRIAPLATCAELAGYSPPWAGRL